MKKRLTSALVFAIVLSLAMPAFALQDYIWSSKIAEYDRDKIKIISYSSMWNSTDKLKSLYEELLKNFHGKEISLLAEIHLYPDPYNNAAGEYRFTYTTQDDGKLALDPNSYINLYDCNKQDTVEKVARTLSHEYGHLFTHYYLIKRENKTFEGKDTLYQKIRGLENNPDINNGEHRWSLAEIAAEDYAQIFGSPTGKQSTVFYDITSRSQKQNSLTTFNTDMYNYCPQENTGITLAANIPEVRKYWLDAFGYTGPSLDNPPAPSYLYLDRVNTINASNYGQSGLAYGYKLRWTPGRDDISRTLEYSLVAYPDLPEGPGIPVKTVYSGSELSALVGSYEYKSTLLGDGILDNVKSDIYFVIYTKDGYGNIVNSNMLEMDLSDPGLPFTRTIRVSDQSSTIRVLYNGDFIQFTDAAPIIVNSRTMVPLRKIFEALGAEIAWNESTHTVTAVKTGTTVTLQLGNYTAYRDGKPIALDVVPQIVNNRTLVPLRFIGEAFGNSVQWDSNAKVAVIR